MAEVSFPPSDLEELCAQHTWGDPVQYPGLLGPSVVWPCLRCTARMHATNVSDPLTRCAPPEHVFLSQELGGPCECGEHTWGGFDRAAPGEVCPVCAGLLGGCATLEGSARPDCPAPQGPAPVTIDQVGCARCGGDGHPGLTFRPLTHPVWLVGASLTHWAPCPANGEPILLWIGDPGDAPGG